MTFSESVGQVRVVFQGIGYRTGGRQMLYSCRLLREVQGEWTAFQSSNTAVFDDLEAGHYRLEARAMDCDGLCSDPAGVDLTITPDLDAARIKGCSRPWPSAPAAASWSRTAP